MMFKTASFFILTLALSAPTLAQIGDETAPQPRRNLIGTSVVLRTLDKVTATTQDYTVKIGDTLDYGSLSITARHCEKKPPEEIPETYAFLQITDARLNGRGETADLDQTIFSGWMFASKPAVSALDHRVYDVWVIDCKVPRAKTEETELRR